MCVVLQFLMYSIFYGGRRDWIVVSLDLHSNSRSIMKVKIREKVFVITNHNMATHYDYVVHNATFIAVKTMEKLRCNKKYSRIIILYKFFIKYYQ